MRFVFQAEDGIRDYKVTGVQTCALPISAHAHRFGGADCADDSGYLAARLGGTVRSPPHHCPVDAAVMVLCVGDGRRDRKSTRLNSSHLVISYAVFCLKKKKTNETESTVQ